MCGDPGEQYWLGVMHKAGTEPAAQDAVAAYKWVSLAAKAGHRLARRSKPKYAQDLTSPQREAVNPIEKIDLASVPEPGTIAIFLIGLGGIVMIRRRTTISS